MFAIDTETQGISTQHGARPFFITLAFDNQTQDFYTWNIDVHTRDVIVERDDLEKVKNNIRRAANWYKLKGKDDPSHWIIGQNIKFDVNMLSSLKGWDIEWPWEITQDTLIASHILASNRKHDLTSLAKIYLGEGKVQKYEDALHKCVTKCRSIARRKYKDWLIAKEGLTLDGKQLMPSAKKGGKESKSGDKDKVWRYDYWLPRAIALHENLPIPIDDCEHDWEDDFVCANCAGHRFHTVLQEYGNSDSAITLALWPVLERMLREQDLWEIYLQQMKLPRIISKMERKGVTMNLKVMKELEDEFTEESNRLEKICINIAKSRGYTISLPKGNRNDSLRDFIFEGLGLVTDKMTKGGENFSMDKHVLDSWENTLPVRSKEALFISSLVDKRARDTSLTYIHSYQKFGIRCGGDFATLHPSANITGTATTRFSMQYPNSQQCCFDSETEILTLDGWVRAENISEYDAVAQYWKNTGEIDFVYPDKIVAYHHKGFMYHIETEQMIDMLLTPNHRCLVRNRKTGLLRDLWASNFKGDYEHLHAGVYIGGKVKYTEEEVIWLCAVQADGSYVKVDGKEYGIVLTFTKQRKIVRLREALNRLQVKYTEKLTPKGQTTFYVGVNESITKLAKKLMPDKIFDSWLLDCDRDTLNLFSEELFFWDGYYTRNGGYSSCIKKNSEWCQIVWTLSGSRANLVSVLPFKEAEKLQHIVQVTKGRNYSLTTNYSNTKIPWDDMVYCVSVPSSYIVTRRNGKVSITGNSKLEKTNLRKGMCPLPDRMFVSMDAQNIELRIPAYEADEKDMIYVFEHPKDPPYFGSYHLLIFDLLHPELFKEYGKSVKTIFEDSWYQWIKNGNFARQYGAQKKKVDETYRVPGAYERVRYRFPKIAKLNDDMIRYAAKYGYVETIPNKTINPRRGYPLWCSRTDDNFVLPTVPLSYHVQSTAGSWMKSAIIKCGEYLDTIPDYHIILTVHDELVFDMPRGKGEKPWEDSLEVINTLSSLMESCGDDIHIPTPVSREIHLDSWAVGISI